MQRDRHGWTFVVDDLRATTQTILHQNAFGEPTVALTTADRLVLAWVENSKKRAVQWTPESCGFDQLGIARAANEVVLAADRRGNLFMASAGDEGQIVVERWSGQAWVPFGPAMPVKVGIIWELGLQLELDPSGLPVAAWLQGDSVQVARWTADAVHRLTDDSGILGSIRLPGVRRPLSLAVAPDGTIVVGWRNISGEPTVGRFDGSRWKQVGGALPGVPGSFGDMGYLNAPVVQVSGNGDLYVAWAGRRIFPENYRTFVARWDGNSWVPVGDFLSSNLLSLGTHDLWMALDTRSRPVVVAAEEIRTGVSRLFTYAWDGAAWTTPAQPLDGQEFETTVGWPRITVDSRGRWLVSWFQSPGDGLLAVYLARFAP